MKDFLEQLEEQEEIELKVKVEDYVGKVVWLDGETDFLFFLNEEVVRITY